MFAPGYLLDVLDCSKLQTLSHCYCSYVTNMANCSHILKFVTVLKS